MPGSGRKSSDSSNGRSGSSESDGRRVAAFAVSLSDFLSAPNDFHDSKHSSSPSSSGSSSNGGNKNNTSYGGNGSTGLDNGDKLSRAPRETTSQIPAPSTTPKHAKPRSDAGAHRYFKHRGEEEAKMNKKEK